MAASTINRVKQTNKTILFEEFRSDRKAPSLYNLIQEGHIKTSDLDDLEVHSFKEFLDKFKPKVYEICQNVDGNPVFSYTADEEKGLKNNGVEVDILSNTYYEMLCRLYDDKGASGKGNLDFDDKYLLDMLSPEQERIKAKDIRNRLERAYEAYYLADSKGEDTSEYVDRAESCREEIVSKYQNSQLALLPLAIGDIDTKIEWLDSGIKSIGGCTSGELALLSSGRMKFDDEGNLKVDVVEGKGIDNTIEQLPAGSVLLLPGPAQIRKDIVDVLSQDYEEMADEQSTFVKSLIIDTYAPPEDFSGGNVPVLLEDVQELKEEYIEKKKYYESIYVQAKNSYIKTLTEVCEKLLSVKIFFDHATFNGYLSNGLIVANCKVSKLLGLGDDFAKFLSYRGKDQVEEKIWFAIIPGVELKNSASGAKARSGMGASLRDRKQEQVLDPTRVTIGSLTKALELLDKSKIMTLFSFKGSEKTGFNAISEEYVREIRNKLEGIDNQHAVVVYPNFCIIRKRRVDVTNNSGVDRIEIPGVFIDACYVACGLLVGSQECDYLEARGYKNRVIKDNVCVHVDLEKIKTGLTTYFNRELGDDRWSGELEKSIEKDMYGFVFRGDGINGDNGKKLKNSYVFSARTLCKRKDYYKSICNVLTEDFVFAYTRTLADKKEGTIAQFIATDVNSWIQASKPKDKANCINLILNPGEGITLDNTIKKIRIQFNDDEAVLNDIDVVSE